MKIILASQSPWRKKLLSWLEIPFDVMVSDFDEKSVECGDPEELVAILAERKASVVAENIDDGLVIGADTIIVRSQKLEVRSKNEKQNDFEIVGKPRDMDHAREILSGLRGRAHKVYTGVAVVDVLTGEKRVEIDVTEMVFKDFADETLEQYLDTEDSMGKAGAYQFLKILEPFVESFEGSVTGVIGLPLKRLSQMLEEMGVNVEVNRENIVHEKIGFRD